MQLGTLQEGTQKKTFDRCRQHSFYEAVIYDMVGMCEDFSHLCSRLGSSRSRLSQMILASRAFISDLTACKVVNSAMFNNWNSFNESSCKTQSCWGFLAWRTSQRIRLGRDGTLRDVWGGPFQALRVATSHVDPPPPGWLQDGKSDTLYETLPKCLWQFLGLSVIFVSHLDLGSIYFRLRSL